MKLSDLVEMDNLAAEESAFLLGLDELLATRDYPGLDRDSVDVSVAPKTGLGVRLPHVSSDYEIQVDIGPHGGLITVGLDHLHVDRHRDHSSIDWPAGANDFVTATVAYTEWLLTGRIEFEEEYRLTGVSTKTWFVNSDGSRSLIQSGRWFVPVWKHRGEHRIISPNYTVQV